MQQTCRKFGCDKKLPPMNEPYAVSWRRRLCYEHWLETRKGKKLLLVNDPPILGGAAMLEGRFIDRIQFHHSASESGNAASFRYYHAVVLGWGAIAYNWVITNGNGGPDGELQFGKPISEYPYSVGVPWINERSLAACWVGNFSAESAPTKRQWATAMELFRKLKGPLRLEREMLRGHREEHANSACPGFSNTMCKRVRIDVFDTPETGEEDDMPSAPVALKNDLTRWQTVMDTVARKESLAITVADRPLNSVTTVDIWIARNGKTIPLRTGVPLRTSGPVYLLKPTDLPAGYFGTVIVNSTLSPSFRVLYPSLTIAE